MVQMNLKQKAAKRDEGMMNSVQGVLPTRSGASSGVGVGNRNASRKAVRAVNRSLQRRVSRGSQRAGCRTRRQ